MPNARQHGGQKQRITMTNGNYTTEDQDKIGSTIGNLFGMGRTKDGKYATGWGDKTAIGLFNMIVVLGQKIRDGEEIKE